MSSEQIPAWAADYARSLLLTVKHKDPHTFYHCCRVGRAARMLAKAMGLSEFEQHVLEYSGLFHDVGKVGIPDSILLKPGRLTSDEVSHMKRHADMSAEIIEPLSSIAFFRFLLPGVKFHHEKIDGSGYPNGLTDENIPLPARVIAVVDTVDAMLNTRPYRQGLPMDVVKKELIDYSGQQFDRSIVNIYLQAQKHWINTEADPADEVVVAKVLKAA